MSHIKLLVKILSPLDSLVICKGDSRNNQYSTRKLLLCLTNACFLWAKRWLPEVGNRMLLLFSWDLLHSIQELFCWGTLGGEGGTAFCGCLPSTPPGAVTATCIAGGRIGAFLCRKIQLLSIWAVALPLPWLASHFIRMCATGGSDWPRSPWKQGNQVGLTRMWFWTLENLLKLATDWVLLQFKQQGMATVCQAAGLHGYAIHVNLWAVTSPLYENLANKVTLRWYVLLPWQSQGMFENGREKNFIFFFLIKRLNEAIWKKPRTNKRNICTSRTFFSGVCVRNLLPARWMSQSTWPFCEKMEKYLSKGYGTLQLLMYWLILKTHEGCLAILGSI